MELITLLKHFEKHPSKITTQTFLDAQENNKLHIKGLVGSSSSLLIASLEHNNKSNIVILDDKEEAAFFYNDLCNILGEKNVLFYPSSYAKSAQYEKIDNSNIILRTEVLRSLDNNNGLFIITHPEAIVEKVISKKELLNNTLNISCGDKISPQFIEEVLVDYNFERTDFVVFPGQYSIRGSIVDIFSFSHEHPYRIDFFGNEIESIRLFDIENQLSISSKKTLAIVPNIQDNTLHNLYISLFEFIDKKTTIWSKNTLLINDKIDSIYKASETKKQYIELEDKKISLHEYLIKGKEFIESLEQLKTIEFGIDFFFKSSQESVNFVQTPQVSFNKNFDLLADHLLTNSNKVYDNYILSDNKKQVERIQNIFDDKGLDVEFTPIDKTLHEGFSDSTIRISCYTDHQIFDRYHKFKLKNTQVHKARETVSLKELNKLQPGDYVVHSDHGIGRFGGLQKIEVNSNQQEVIRLVYKDNDILFVSLHSLHKISRYKGKDGFSPKVYKLGTQAWQKLKTKTKSKVKDIARELISLYAKRKSEKGFAFSPDSYMQQELEASFIYEDTPDQLKATKQVKKAMESPYPMDCLVCGDVGFGKTEIAIRAAFKAVADNKQVAILVPTTILALQHYKTFISRLDNFPCNIDYISRMRKPKEVKEALKKLKEGQIDILIGTHRIIGKDVSFKDLGLLIIDEEQKFGVSVKEKLKQFKVNVDTLTLTATPIPRTLQFSLMGARDLSIINTPPPNRYPIITEVNQFDEEVIKEAINYEVNRNGQVFFIHNRVNNITEVEALIQRLVPGVKTVVAHGQMEGAKLEKIMLDYIRGDYDVLIATTIIESGLDIPNANTIIINNGQNFGLSELHQLRGRVGRSNKKAFCYVLTPPLASMSKESRHRLKAIEDFSELGSGFNIAMQDLDIRGAGNLLGGEQSGFITDIGIETYQRILKEAMLELRETEFKHVFDDNKDEDVDNLNKRYISECHIDTDLEVLFPDEYIENISERLRLYRELDNTENIEELLIFRQQLEDRFGELPQPTVELLDAVQLRWLCLDIGIEKLILKSTKMVLYFISDQGSEFYESAQFTNILSIVQTQLIACEMKEKRNKLSLHFTKVKTIKEAIEILKKLTK